MIMIWICISIYILGALFTGIFTYIGIIRKYLKENSHVKFSYWLDNKEYLETISLTAIFWFIVVPMAIIMSPIRYLIKRINKHYNVEL